MCSSAVRACRRETGVSCLCLLLVFHQWMRLPWSRRNTVLRPRCVLRGESYNCLNTEVRGFARPRPSEELARVVAQLGCDHGLHRRWYHGTCWYQHLLKLHPAPSPARFVPVRQRRRCLCGHGYVHAIISGYVCTRHHTYILLLTRVVAAVRVVVVVRVVRVVLLNSVHKPSATFATVPAQGKTQERPHCW